MRGGGWAIEDRERRLPGQLHVLEKKRNASVATRGGLEQGGDRRLHPRIHRLSRQMQDAHVLEIRPPGRALEERVIAAPKSEGREQRRGIAVTPERPGLAQEEVDEIAVVDVIGALPAKPRVASDGLPLIPGQTDRARTPGCGLPSNH